MSKNSENIDTSFDIPKDIILSLNNHENIILHAPGGTGKTFILRQIAIYLKKQGREVACCATTGIAAINLNIPEEQIVATTLHSWAGVGLAKQAPKKLFVKVNHDSRAKKRWRQVEVLILDEVSMFGATLFEKLDYIAKKIRLDKDTPFGGIQLVLSGDFLQLPPVKDQWVFKSKAWKCLNITPFIFNQPKRYDDEDYFNLLLRIRKGKQTYSDLKKLKARVKAHDLLKKDIKSLKTTNIVKPTILYSRRVDVDYHNEKELKKLKTPTKEYMADDIFTKHSDYARYDYYIKTLDDIIPKSIALKIGAQVMLKCNLDVKKGLANGSRGVVLEMTDEYVKVRFINGLKVRVSPHVWEIQDKDAKATRAQIPLILAWSLTIHKSQGATLDYCVCDLGPSVFAFGQSYVALSRVRNLKGLFVSDFYPSSIKTSKTALKYDEELEKKSEEMKKIIHNLDELSLSDSDLEYEPPINDEQTSDNEQEQQI